MSRVQLALNVSDLGSAIEFYTKLFGTEPAKVREGYANFAIADPPLKLVLLESSDPSAERLNHLGIEVESAEAVAAATRRLDDSGLETDVEDETTCCFAVQDKVWVNDPDDAPWEIYTVLADSETFGTARLIAVDGGGSTTCCS